MNVLVVTDEDLFLAYDLGYPENDGIHDYFDLANWIREDLQIDLWVEHGCRDGKKKFTHDIVISKPVNFQLRGITNYQKAWKLAVQEVLKYLNNERKRKEQEQQILESGAASQT